MFEQRTSIHDLFDINDELSAYVLGFWYADGSIGLYRDKKVYRKRWYLYNTDYDGLSTILTAISYGREPTQKTNCTSTKPCYTASVYSDKLFDYCYACLDHVDTKKSASRLKLPDISTDLFHHFVRGLFDGDGSIYYVNYNNRHGKQTSELRTSFTAGLNTEPFLSDLLYRISSMIPVKRRTISVGKNNQKIMFGQYDSMLLCSFMYNDDTIAFQRKKKIWNTADKQRLLNSRKYSGIGEDRTHTAI